MGQKRETLKIDLHKKKKSFEMKKIVGLKLGRELC
jgi:hypothetical protein